MPYVRKLMQLMVSYYSSKLKWTFFYSFSCFVLPIEVIETRLFVFLNMFYDCFERDEYHEF